MQLLSVLASALVLGFRTRAQFPPKPEGVTVLRSKFHENVTISFKEPGICETTPGVKSYAGYVHLPPGFLDDGSEHGEPQDYPINTFFWFFEARNKPAAEAPLAIWLNGGPGASSLLGVLQENGPCFVANDSSTTYLNPWSWNNEVNMLYIDQPAQVGFSYDVLTNATVQLHHGEEEEEDDGETDYYEIVPTNFTGAGPDLGALVNLTSGVGTFGSQRADRGTANSTRRAAHALWHFAQAWFGEFPHYEPRDGRISLWAESYGGHYGPGFARFFQEMNERIASGGMGGPPAAAAEEQEQEQEEHPHAHYLHLDTLGIVNGLIDFVTQMESYMTFPSYNTYNIHIFDPALEGELWHNWSRPHGCRAQVTACADSLREHDPASLGLLLPNTHTHTEKQPIGEVCTNATEECAMAPWSAYVSVPAADGARGWYDIAHPKFDPFPPPYYLGYLKQAHVQAALGVPVNFTPTSHVVNSAFTATHDHLRSDFLSDIAWLLDHDHDTNTNTNTNNTNSSGSRFSVHLLYGDRDYAANWVGGEAASLAVPWAHQAEFSREAGYAELFVPTTPPTPPTTTTTTTPADNDEEEEEEEEEQGVAGLTRQLGPLSFTRVFQAGHEVPAYAPEAAHAVFARAVAGRDVATGRVPITTNTNNNENKNKSEMYRTRGPRHTWEWFSLEPSFPEPRCCVLEPRTCAPEVWARVRRGQVRVRDWFVVEEEEEVKEGEGEEEEGGEEIGIEGLKDFKEGDGQVVIGEL